MGKMRRIGIELRLFCSVMGGAIPLLQKEESARSQRQTPNAELSPPSRSVRLPHSVPNTYSMNLKKCTAPPESPATTVEPSGPAATQWMGASAVNVATS
jgi:hypothetical protein